MSADGNWKLTMDTPMGAQSMTASFKTSGDTFTGQTQSQLGTSDIQGKVSGDTLTWSSQITSPMPMKLDFTAKIAGDKLDGNVELGSFGSAKLTGERA